jgi:hypothetical protein
MAFAVSIVGHALGFAFLLPAGDGGRSVSAGQGIGDVAAMEVTLEPATAATSAAASASSKAAPVQPDPAAELLARLNAQSSEAMPVKSTSPPSRSTSLEELLGEGRGKTRELSMDQGDATNGKATAQASSSGGAAAGALWGVVEPCWRRLAVSRQAKVRLEIDLNLMGRLRGPPKVIRDDHQTLDRTQLQAEAAALEALRTCLPTSQKKFSGVYLLDFNKN